MRDNEGKTESIEYNEKIPLRYCVGAKITVLILMLLCCGATAMGVAGLVSTNNQNFYSIYGNRFCFYVIIPSVVLTLVCFIFLIRAAGCYTKKDEMDRKWWFKVPFDLFTIAVVGLCLLQACIYGDYMESVNGIRSAIAYAGCPFFVAEVLFATWCIHLAACLRLRVLWKNSAIKFIIHAVRILVKRIPFIWKTAVTVTVLSVLEIIVLCNVWLIEWIVAFWVIEKLIVVPAIIYFALMLNRLRRAGKEMAEGNLNYKVDTKGLFLECREHADNLNSIADGMTIAVEKQLKSERMKTELITNVSHDIKTPLTSIVNYSDLISKESCDNQKITEYAEVLLRQSERLKKLIEDLVEASKASTGNLDVMMAACDADIFLPQAVGEYERRIEDAGLEVIIRQPDTPVSIMADGRRMWRVFDNLMNNICKYAQRGTRVYLNLEIINGEAVFTLKNISETALNVSAEELMERFVRGDVSRNTEGNGLGLSIAKSLVELQNGSFDISIDGDLFKVVMGFPIVEATKS